MKKLAAILGTVALALSLGAPAFASPARAPQRSHVRHRRHHARHGHHRARAAVR